MASYANAVIAIIDYAYAQAQVVAQAQGVSVDRRLPYFDLRSEKHKSNLTVAIESPTTASVQATQGAPNRTVYQTDGTLPIAVWIPRQSANYKVGLNYVSAYIEEFRGKPTQTANITFYNASITPAIERGDTKVAVWGWELTIDFQFYTQRAQN